MLAVVILASFIIIVPQNLYHTISGENFVTYIGVGNCDLRMDIQQTAQVDEKTVDIGSYMENDPEIANYALFVSKIFPIKLGNGETKNLKVELGDHTVFPLQYTEGRLPARENEIALSSIYADHFSYAKVSSIDEYMAQTFGETLESVRMASIMAVLVSAVIVLLVILLFVKLLTAKDRYSIAVLRAVGFTSSDIQRQYAWRALLILAAGILLGTVLARTLGEKLSAVAISSLSATTFQFTINPFTTYVFSPLILVVSGLLATIWGTFHAGNVKLCQSIKE